MPATLATPQRPPSAAGQPDGDYVVFYNVPIFDEHTGEDGITYDRRLLECIAANNNRRIQDTGDWCPLVIGHTADPDDFTANGQKPPDPPVVGFAGPFRVARFGNTKPRWCIYTNFWLFKDQQATWRAYPRRSVEVWPEERPEDRYFDPIALLGSETPRRDLGLTYSKRRTAFASPHRQTYPRGVSVSRGRLVYSRGDTRTVQRYEAASPGGANTFLPTTGGTSRRRPHKYQEAAAMLDEEEINQIIEAISPKFQAMLDETLGQPGANVGDEFGTPPPPADPMGAGAPPVDPMAGPPADPMGAPPMGGPPMDPMSGGAGAPPPPADPLGDAMAGLSSGGAGAPPPAAPPPAAGGAPPPGPDMGILPGEDDKKKKFGMGLAAKFRKYAKANDEAGAKGFFASLDDEDKDAVKQYMKDAGEDEADAKIMYSKCGGEVDDKDRDDMPSKYAKASRQRDHYKLQYHKAAKERDELAEKYHKATKQLATALGDARSATRAVELTKLQAEGYVIPDVAQEVEETADLTPEKFTAHLAKIREHYTRVPLHTIPVDDSAPLIPRNPAHADAAADAFADRAEKVAMKLSKKGRPMTYSRVMNKLLETKGKITDEELVTQFS